MSDVKSIKVEEYDLVSFVMQIQSAILQGYEVTDSSDEAPMCIGHCYHVIMREATKPFKVVETLVVEASIDTTKLQEQLKVGGEVEQMIADSLVVGEVKDFTDEHVAAYENVKQKELHETFIEGVPIPEPEPTLDESLPKEEQATLQTKQPTKRGRK